MYHNQTGFVQGLRGLLSVSKNKGEKKCIVVIMIISIDVENHLTKLNTF